MIGLPKSTELSKQLPKKIIYEKFKMNTLEKDKLDSDIKKIMIANEISEGTVNLEKGKEVTGIFVLLISLKQKNFDIRTIEKISKLINQNILFVLEYEEEAKLAACYPKLIQTEWKFLENLTIDIKGLNLDDVWKNIIIQIGRIDVEEGKSLEDQIITQGNMEKIKKKIMELIKKARTEKQPKKKFEIFQEIKKLEKEMGEK